ncbi:hypothetical protein [Chryseobacterium wanjuense]
MDKFKNLKLEDDVVTGKYNFYDREVNVEFDLEEDGTEMDDFSELISDADGWIENLTQGKPE